MASNSFLRAIIRAQCGQRSLSSGATVLIALIMTSGARPAYADTIIAINATDDIYGAGRSASASDGLLPPVYSFAAGLGQALEVSDSGTWLEDSPFPSDTDGSRFACGGHSGVLIGATGGISSYTADFCSALVGVFLTDAAPSGTAPSGLCFDDSSDISGCTPTDFASLSPAIGQVFFIGDGLTGDGTGSEQLFVVPSGATRLFLGEADSCNFNGPPSCFFDNVGAIDAALKMTTIAPAPPAPDPADSPEPGTLVSLGGALVSVGLIERIGARKAGQVI